MKRLLIATALLALSATAFSQADPASPAAPASSKVDYIEIGNRYIEQRNYPGAEKNFREALKTDSLNPVYQSQLAFSLLKQNRHSEAQHWLYKVLAAYPDHAPSLWYAGINNFEDESNKDFRKPLAYFDKVLPLLDPVSGQYFSATGL